MRILIIILFLFLSCNQKDDSAELNPNAAKLIKELNNSDTFRFEFPFSYDHRIKGIDSSIYYYLLKLDSFLNLKPLNKGVDSIEIRFINGCVDSQDFLMISLNHNNQKWTAEISRIKEYFNIELPQIDSFSREIRYDRPRSGWKEFISKLFELRTLSIEDESAIQREEHLAGTHGCRYFFEIATGNVYRSYGYTNPQMNNSDFWQVSNVNAIKDLLYKEFVVLNKWHEQIEKDEFREREIRLRKKEDKLKNKKPIINNYEISDTSLLEK